MFSDGLKKVRNIGTFILLIVSLTACGNGKTEKNDLISWQDSLYVPTMVQKIDDTYFIVDCWHHRVIYNDNLTDPVREWKTMTDESYIGGHTIASDGEIYVMDNTDNSQVVCYTKNEQGDFVKGETFGGIEGRPHYTLYDEEKKLFYVLSSTGSRIYVFDKYEKGLRLLFSQELKELEGGYCRSVSLIDGKLYTSAASGRIYEYSTNNDGKFTLEAGYDVADRYAGMNQITKIQDYYYITVNTDSTGNVDSADILRVKDLSELAQDHCMSVKKALGISSQPYFISSFDGHYYITYISAESANGIKRFDVSDNEIHQCEGFYDMDKPDQESLARYQIKYPVSVTGKEKSEVVDLVIFAGQSNMSGKSGQPQMAPGVSHGYEFRAVTDPENLYHIYEPFGINENVENGIDDTWTELQRESMRLRKCGGMVSAFANAYYDASGVPVVAVSASEGATKISEWTAGGRLNDLLQRIASAKTYLQKSQHFDIRNVFLVWCQGESDGDAGTTQDDYLASLNDLREKLVVSGVVDFMLVIQTGENTEKEGAYDGIQQAQKLFCDQHTDCEMISELAKTFLKEGKMRDSYHYTQNGYNILGKDAGVNAASYIRTHGVSERK